MEYIPILVSLPEEDEDVKGIFSSDGEIGSLEIPTERLQENLTKVCQGVTEVLSHVKQVGDFKLKQVTIQVEVTAEGGVELIGTAKIGGKGAITLTFSE